MRLADRAVAALIRRQPALAFMDEVRLRFRE
jgi:hypothetical protein